MTITDECKKVGKLGASEIHPSAKRAFAFFSLVVARGKNIFSRFVRRAPARYRAVERRRELARAHHIQAPRTAAFARRIDGVVAIRARARAHPRRINSFSTTTKRDRRRFRSFPDNVPSAHHRARIPRSLHRGRAVRPQVRRHRRLRHRALARYPRETSHLRAQLQARIPTRQRGRAVLPAARACEPRPRRRGARRGRQGPEGAH